MNNKLGKQIISGSEDSSSKRVAGLYLILLSTITYILDALGIMHINTEVCIYLISGGVLLLTGTVIEKFSKHRYYDNEFRSEIDSSQDIRCGKEEEL